MNANHWNRLEKTLSKEWEHNNRMNSEVDIVKISISSGPDTLLRLKIWLSKGICWNVKFSKPKHHMNFLKPMSIFRYTQKTNNRMNSEDDIVRY